MRLIDADALPKDRVEWEDIINAPTIDAVEVVRCKDCKYLDTCHKRVAIKVYDEDIECYYTTFEKLTFCSYGERKEE